MATIMQIFASALTSTLITSCTFPSPDTQWLVVCDSAGKNLPSRGVAIVLALLLGRALFGGGGLTQKYTSISLTLAVGAFMTPSMPIHSSRLMIPTIVIKA